MIQRISKLSIKRKLIAIILLTSGIALTVASLVFVINEAIIFRKGERQELAALADILGNNTSAAVAFNDQQAAAEILTSLRAKPQILAAYVIARDGTILAKYLAKGLDKKRLKLSQAESTSSRIDSATVSRIVSENNSLWSLSLDTYGVRPIILDNQEIGTVVIYSDSTELSEKLLMLFAVVLLVMLGTLP